MSSWFLVSAEKLRTSGYLHLEGDDFAHLKALRLTPGETLVIADGRGKAFQGRLVKMSSGKAEVEILGELSEQVEPPLRVTLFAGLSKGEKMDFIVRSSVELGVRRIVPVLMERTVVRITSERGQNKARRWQNVAAAAAAQCRRSHLPEVFPPLTFEESLELLGEEELVIVPWEEEKSCGLRDLAGLNLAPSAVSIFTGPEGGISRLEMEKLKELPRVHAVTLGPRILRAETAPLAVLAIVMYLWGDLAGRRR